MGATSDPRKGFKELKEALSKLKNPENIELLVFGSAKPHKPSDLGLVTHYLGSLSDDISLVTLYNSADLMVVPSLQENLSNAIMESLACGTPVVGFNIGGNSDLIDHKKNGYLAYPQDSNDLLKGIEWVLNNNEYDQLSLNSRSKVLDEFDSKVGFLNQITDTTNLANNDATMLKPKGSPISTGSPNTKNGRFIRHRTMA